ncbi:MAG: domain protein beta Propeller [Deltaproteobacteria bacterium]|nr:domain protein beta Propeller [Deltaproteobacteria bacterium]
MEKRFNRYGVRVLNKTKKALLALLYIFIVTPYVTDAKVYLKIGSPTIQLLPIAIPNLSADGEAAVIASKVSEVITSDLETSGILNILDKAIYPADPLKAELSPEMIDFKPWLAIGAEALVKGKVVMEGRSLTVDARLYDVTAGRQVMKSSNKRDAKELRKVAHELADSIIENLTGEKGVFSTRIAFVSNVRGNKEIFTMDYDGEGVEAVTQNGSINISPGWSPDGSAISYVSFKEGRSAVYIKEVRSGNDRRLSLPEGTSMGASWAPDGQRLAVVISRNGNADIYAVNRDGSDLTRLTDSWGLDVSPSWSPTGKEIAFVSDRGGNPQIYIMDSSGGNIRRLTFDGKYNASPSWSSKGDRIAFAGISDGKFEIFTINPDGSGLMRLTTDAENNEGPMWSPDGRFITFSSAKGGGIYIMRSDGTGRKKVTSMKGRATNPSWGPRVEVP